MTMSKGADDEEILNVFREKLEDPHSDTLTTDDLAEELDVVSRTAQDYVRTLEQDNHLVLESEGKPNHWQLADTEPSEPVYDPRLAKAKRRANMAHIVGNWSVLIGIAVYASVGFITSNHVFTDVVGMSLPLIDGQDAVIAALTGFSGSFLFLVAFVAYTAAAAIPRLVEWWIDEPIPE